MDRPSSSLPYSREPQHQRSTPGPAIVVHDPDVASQPPTVEHSLFTELAAAQLHPIDESSSTSQQSSDFEHSTDPTTGAGTPVGGLVIPETITYTLRAVFEQEEVPVAENRGSIGLNDALDYRKLEISAEASVKKHCAHALAGKFLDFRNGECVIDGSDVGNNVHGLSSQDDWKDICTKLTKSWTPNRDQQQHLIITRNYVGVLTRKFSDDESFTSAKRSEIDNLMKGTFNNGKDYIAGTDLMRITSTETVRQIILEDPIRGLNQFEQEGFINEVLQRGRKLLAACVYTGLRMKCLKQLLGEGHGDDTLPTAPFVYQDVCHPSCGPRFKHLVGVHGGFYAAEFWVVGENKRLHNCTVVPLRYHPRDPCKVGVQNEAHETRSEVEARNLAEEDATSQKLACCGSGAYSNVYRVRLDPEQHRLTKDKNADFAVKVFKDHPQRTSADFNKELRVLDELRKYSNDHIVTHLATWTQDDRYYMLFPYAQCNLRQYMRRMKFGKFTKKNTLWLLRQFLGLASALRQIHNLSNTETAPEASAQLHPPAKDLRKSGWHHDLKPENILYFKPSSSSVGGLQVADFGSGKVHNYRSGSVNTKSPNGTPSYEPPEAAKEGVTSRPYDVWSMGCVFLELLVWATFGHASVKLFASARDGRRFPGSKTDITEDDAFWQMYEGGNISLRESVYIWITKLRQELRGRAPRYFGNVLDLIIRMLDTERQARISALNLWDTLDRIYQQATVDMSDLEQDSLPAKAEKESGDSLGSLLQLSLSVPDPATPESVSPIITARPDMQLQRNNLFSGTDYLTTVRVHRRNSSASDYAPSWRSPGSSRSSTRVHERSSPVRAPDPLHEESGTEAAPPAGDYLRLADRQL